MKQHTTKAKDFFLQLGLMVSLYAATIALLNILFNVINVVYPRVDMYFGTPSISFAVATVVVFFPLFLVLSYFIQKGFKSDPSRKDFVVRTWLLYITLFVAGLVIAGDLVTLLYFFLDGRELTVGFLLKALSVAVVGGAVFWYFLDDLRGALTDRKRTFWRVFAILIVLASLVLGFMVLGSPRTQRLMRYDEARITDLQNIQHQIISYWQSKEILPEDLMALEDSLSFGSPIPLEDREGNPYTYRVIDSLTFELCGTFHFDSDEKNFSSLYPRYGGEFQNENWAHESGEYCFERTIDPEIYPALRKI